AGRHTLELRPERADVAVGIDVDGRSREPAAVDDAGMVERVAEDVIPAADERADGAHVGLVAGGKEQRRLGALEGRELGFDLDVQVEMARNETRRPGPASP